MRHRAWMGDPARHPLTRLTSATALAAPPAHRLPVGRAAQRRHRTLPGRSWGAQLRRLQPALRTPHHRRDRHFGHIICRQILLDHPVEGVLAVSDCHHRPMMPSNGDIAMDTCRATAAPSIFLPALRYFGTTPRRASRASNRSTWAARRQHAWSGGCRSSLPTGDRRAPERRRAPRPRSRTGSRRRCAPAPHRARSASRPPGRGGRCAQRAPARAT